MEDKSIFSKFNPKQNFFFGVATTIILICVIGFFVLLGMMAKGSDESLTIKNRAADTPPTQASPPQPNGPVALAPITDEDWIRGNKNARVSIVEFSDTECPFCQRFHPTMKQILQEYPDEVNWVYRHFPLTSIHPKAPKEAEATECAGELAGNNGFWAYIDRLFEITPANNKLDPAQLPQIAEDVGINRKAFETCLNSGKYAQKIQDHTAQALAAGAQGTPYSVLVVDGETVPISGAVPFEQLKTIIDSVLK